MIHAFTEPPVTPRKGDMHLTPRKGDVHLYTIPGSKSWFMHQVFVKKIAK